MTKTILVIAQHLLDRNMGAIRLRRIVRLLPRHGFQPVVLTRQGPVPADIAHELACVQLIHVQAPDLASAYRKIRISASAGTDGTTRNIGVTSALNRWLMIPDRQAPWCAPAIREGRRLLLAQQPDIIFASLGPRTNLLVASRLARSSGIPVVMEYRDLWTSSPYHHLAQPTALHRWIHRRLERGALRAADRVTAVSRGVAAYLEQTYRADLRGPVALNHNFFDPEEYPVRARIRSRRFAISYVGAMYFTRQPRIFFEGLRLFLDRHALQPDDFVFQWVGSTYSLGDVDTAIDELRLRPYLEIRGEVPHSEALQLLVDSDAALIIQSPNDDVHIPGKLFEAMGARVPVLAIAQPCEVSEIIESTRCGIVAEHTALAVAVALEHLWTRWRGGDAWDFNVAECAHFSADQAVGQMAQLFSATCRFRP